MKIVTKLYHPRAKMYKVREEVPDSERKVEAFLDSNPGYVVIEAEEPSDEQMEDWLVDVELPEALDGCPGIDPDGFCPHGYPTWLMYYGLT